ncbi:MAG: hypothetical protein IIZ35_04365 [Clostridia bacterium]|nr:hypothetical protein [Clostridia bacterium]
MNAFAHRFHIILASFRVVNRICDFLKKTRKNRKKGVDKEKSRVYNTGRDEAKASLNRRFEGASLFSRTEYLCKGKGVFRVYRGRRPVTFLNEEFQKSTKSNAEKGENKNENGSGVFRKSGIR